MKAQPMPSRIIGGGGGGNSELAAKKAAIEDDGAGDTHISLLLSLSLSLSISISLSLFLFLPFHPSKFVTSCFYSRVLVLTQIPLTLEDAHTF
jgi:hypothetical protein